MISVQLQFKAAGPSCPPVISPGPSCAENLELLPVEQLISPQQKRSRWRPHTRFWSCRSRAALLGRGSPSTREQLTGLLSGSQALLGTDMDVEACPLGQGLGLNIEACLRIDALSGLNFPVLLNYGVLLPAVKVLGMACFGR